MLNYIKSECYKTWKRLYTRIFLLVLVLFAFAMSAGIFIIHFVTQSDVPIFQLIMASGFAFIQTPIYFAIIFSDIVFSEEYKYRTLKNTLSFGITRTQIYFGKLIVSILLAVLTGLILFIVFIGSALIFSGIPDDWSPLFMLVNHFATALPIYFGALCLSHAAACLIPNNTAFSFTYIGIILIPPLFLFSLSAFFTAPFIAELNNWTLSTPLFDVLSNLDSWIGLRDFVHYFAVGALHVILSTVIGLFVFRKREIK